MTLPVSRHAALAAKPFTMTLVIAAAFSSPAFAQTTQDDKTLAPVLVTATRTPQSIRDVLSDNIVITSEEIERSGYTSIVDLLQQKRGIEVTRNGGAGASSSVFIRGTENKQNVVLVDGVRMGSSTTGGATWSAIPLSQIDRIEIVYGPLSTLYGADAIGGVVQIFTKRGEGTPRPTVMAGYGSYATRSLEASVSGSTSGDHVFRYAISAAHEDSDGFSATKPGNFSFNADKDGYKKDSASGQFSLGLAKGHEVGFIFLQSRLDSQFDSGPSTYDAHGISKIGSYALYSKNQFTPDWNSQVQLAHSIDNSASFSSSVPSIANTTQNELSWQNDLKLGRDILQLLVGRREEKVDSTSAAVVGQRSTNYAAASYLLKRGAHLGNLSLRNDTSSQFGSHNTGSVGYGYQFAPAWRANASVGTSFRAPTFNELYYPGFGNPSNRPEEGKNSEVGVYYQQAKTQFSAVYYHNSVTNLIVNTNPCPVMSALYPYGCAYNVDKALLTGVTLGASTVLGTFTVRGSLDLQDPHDETTGKDLPRRAKRHGSVAVEYGAGRVRAGAESVFSGKRFDTAANTTTLGGYGLLNLYASYDVAPNWSVFGRWNNVLNKDYELARSYATAGSNLFVGIRYGL